MKLYKVIVDRQRVGSKLDMRQNHSNPMKHHIWGDEHPFTSLLIASCPPKCGWPSPKARWIAFWVTFAPEPTTRPWKCTARTHDTVYRGLLGSRDLIDICVFFPPRNLQIPLFRLHKSTALVLKPSSLRKWFQRFNLDQVGSFGLFSLKRQEWSYGYADKGSGVFCCPPKALVRPLGDMGPKIRGWT